MANQGQTHMTLVDTCPSLECVSDPWSGLPLTPRGLHEGLLERHGHHSGVMRPNLILSHRGVSWSSVWSLWLTFSHPIIHKKLITCLRGGTSSSKQTELLERTRRINKCSEFAFDRLIQSLTLSSSLEDQGQASPGSGRDMGTFEWPGDSGHRLL